MDPGRTRGRGRAPTRMRRKRRQHGPARAIVFARRRGGGCKCHPRREHQHLVMELIVPRCAVLWFSLAHISSQRCMSNRMSLDGNIALAPQTRDRIACEGAPDSIEHVRTECDLPSFWGDITDDTRSGAEVGHIRVGSAAGARVQGRRTAFILRSLCFSRCCSLLLFRWRGPRAAGIVSVRVVPAQDLWCVSGAALQPDWPRIDFDFGSALSPGDAPGYSKIRERILPGATWVAFVRRSLGSVRRILGSSRLTWRGFDQTWLGFETSSWA